MAIGQVCRAVTMDTSMNTTGIAIWFGLFMQQIWLQPYYEKETDLRKDVWFDVCMLLRGICIQRTQAILILRFENLFNLLRWNAANVSWIALLGTTFDIYLYQFNIQHLLSQIWKCILVQIWCRHSKHRALLYPYEYSVIILIKCLSVMSLYNN